MKGIQLGGDPAGNPWVNHCPIRFMASQPTEGQSFKRWTFANGNPPTYDFDSGNS